MTFLGDALEGLSKTARGLEVALSGAALQYLMFGHRVCFMEICSGRMFVGQGFQAVHPVPDGEIECAFPLGWDGPWCFGDRGHQERMRRVVQWIDPIILHCSPPLDVVTYGAAGGETTINRRTLK